MNVRNTLKAMAVALPMAVAPMKSSAQTIAKESVNKASQTVVDARLGLGYGRTAFFHQMHYEPKIAASITSRGNDFVVGADALVGKTNQEFKAFAGLPVSSGKAGHIDLGAVARYQHNTSGATEGMILSSEVNSTAADFAESVSLNRSKGFIGGYVAPTLKVGDVDIMAHAEAGMASFADFGSHAKVARADVPEVIRDERMVNRSNAKFSTNLGVSIDADLQDGIRAGLDVNHCSFDHSTTVMAKMTYQLDRLANLFRHKK